MARKNRNDLTSVTGSKIYDNNAKAILPVNVREVFADNFDSFFNLMDDTLDNQRYNASKTLAQYLSDVVGSLPRVGAVSGIDIGGGGGVTVSGIVSSASKITSTFNNMLLEVNFSESIAGKNLVPVLQYTSSNWLDQSAAGYPAIRIISSTKINVAFREFGSDVQNLTLKIIAL